MPSACSFRAHYAKKAHLRCLSITFFVYLQPIYVLNNE